MRFLLLIFFFFCFNSCQLFSSQKKVPVQAGDIQEKSKERRKLGLFISGAGVHTFSSLSLLELLQNIPFDFTAGTGWGAWLAALYAKNQSVDELKWNLFKLQEQGIFETKWFDNKRSRAKLLKTLIKETFSSPLQTSFTCPVLDKKGHVSWPRGKRPAQTVLSCLNLLPPFFFSFDNRGKQGSLFSVESTMKYMERQGIDLILWIKPFLHPSLKKSKDKLSSLFWKDLFSHLNETKKKFLYPSFQIKSKRMAASKHPRSSTLEKKGKIIILKTPPSPISLDDFSKIKAIIKTPPSFSEKKKIAQLKHLMEKRTKNEEVF